MNRTLTTAIANDKVFVTLDILPYGVQKGAWFSGLQTVKYLQYVIGGFAYHPTHDDK